MVQPPHPWFLGLRRRVFDPIYYYLDFVLDFYSLRYIYPDLTVYFELSPQGYFALMVVLVFVPCSL